MDNHQTELLKQLNSLEPWHHKIDLGNNVFTTENPEKPNPEEKWKQIEPYVPKDLSGKTVLDLGCNSGYFSVQMKKRGASRVVSVDNNDLALKQVNFLAKWFNVELEIIKEEAHIFCLTTDEQFDYVIFLGLFYHLKYPVLVLDRLTEMAKSLLYFQTAVIGTRMNVFEPQNDYSRQEIDEKNKAPDFPKLFFIETKYEKDLTNWWIPNDSALLSLIRNAQLDIIARPSRAVFVCKPIKSYGKKKIEKKLVFPKYGKEGLEEF